MAPIGRRSLKPARAYTGGMRDRGDEFARIGMRGIFEHLRGGAFLDDASRLHNDHAVAQ